MRAFRSCHFRLQRRSSKGQRLRRANEASTFVTPYPLVVTADYKRPSINLAGVPLLSLSSSVVMKQGKAAEAAKTLVHLLHIILGSGHCGGVSAQRSEIVVIAPLALVLGNAALRPASRDRRPLSPPTAEQLEGESCMINHGSTKTGY